MALIVRYRWPLLVAVLCTLSLLVACSDFGYYVQSARGHMEVMSQTRPIGELIDDPTTASSVRDRLAEVLAIREFAVDELSLPDNGSYRHYADIGRPFVVWNVVAAYEFSLEPKEWCFPIAGCVPYRGYFDQANAEEFADAMEAEGMDVTVFGVPAYSTLQWFDDPVLNTFVNVPGTRLPALIFHELAHQQVYIPDDSFFNEAFAKTVEMEGVRRWVQATASANEWQDYLERERQIKTFQNFLQATRQDLRALYQRSMDFRQKREAKIAVFEQAGERYRQLKDTGQLDSRFDNWMAQGLNNARLASMATYHDLVPAFQVLLARSDHNLEKFYAEVERIGAYPQAERLSILRHWMQSEQHAALAAGDEESPVVAD